MTLTRYFKIVWSIQGESRVLAYAHNDPRYVSDTVKRAAFKHEMEEMKDASIEQIRWDEYQALISQARVHAQ